MSQMLSILKHSFINDDDDDDNHKQPLHAKRRQSDSMNGNICEINVALNRSESIILYNFLSLSHSV